MTKRQWYVNCMEWRELNRFYKACDGMPRWDKNWRDKVDKLFEPEGRRIPGTIKRRITYAEVVKL